MSSRVCLSALRWIGCSSSRRRGSRAKTIRVVSQIVTRRCREITVLMMLTVVASIGRGVSARPARRPERVSLEQMESQK